MLSEIDDMVDGFYDKNSIWLTHVCLLIELEPLLLTEIS